MSAFMAKEPSSLFVESDFIDLQSLARKLNHPTRLAGVSKYLAKRLSSGTRTLMSNHKGGPDEPLRRALVLDLNHVIEKSILYTKGRFDWVSLSPVTKALLEEKPRGTRRIRLNRMLLEDTYPGELLTTPKTINEIAILCETDVRTVLNAAKNITGFRGLTSPECRIENRLLTRLFRVLSPPIMADSGNFHLRREDGTLAGPAAPYFGGFKIDRGYGSSILRHSRHDIPTAAEQQLISNDDPINPQQRAVLYGILLAKIEQDAGESLKREREALKHCIDDEQKREMLSWIEDLKQEQDVYPDYKQLAELWRVAPNWSDDQIDWILNKIVAIQLHWLPLLEFMGNLHKEVDKVLEMTIARCIDLLRQRSEQRNEGSESAARRLIELAIRGARELQWLSERNPKVVETVSKKYASWPLLRSHHPKFSQPHEDIPRNLGADFGFCIYKGAQWNPAAWSSVIARQLKDYVASFREGLPENGSLGGPFKGPDPLFREAHSLAPLSRDTAKAWWEVAEAMFLESYPQPEATVELRSLSSAARRPASYTKSGVQRKQEGLIRQQIIDSIRKAFLYAAGVKRKDPNRSPKSKKVKRK
jgi:hypothetical protein